MAMKPSTSIALLLVCILLAPFVAVAVHLLFHNLGATIAVFVIFAIAYFVARAIINSDWIQKEH